MSLDTLELRVNKAIAQAKTQAKINIIQFLKSTPLLPKKTGQLVESGINSLLSTGLRDKLDFSIIFNTPYADYVQRRTSFKEKIEPELKRIVYQAIEQAFIANGIDAEVKPDG